MNKEECKEYPYNITPIGLNLTSAPAGAVVQR